MRLRDILDPDRDLRNLDKLEHFLGCFGLCAFFDLTFLSTGSAFLFTLWTAAVYEVGQLDVAYSLKDSSGRRYAGQPGYGIGWLDWLVGAVGALLWVGVRAVL